MKRLGWGKDIDVHIIIPSCLMCLENGADKVMRSGRDLMLCMFRQYKTM